MTRTVAFLAAVAFVFTFAVPAFADTNSWVVATKDKTARGIENGLFGLSGQLYHGVNVRGKKGILPGMTAGLWDGIHLGVLRTLVGAYEIATPFYHDKPLLTDLDTVIKS